MDEMKCQNFEYIWVNWQRWWWWNYISRMKFT